MGRNPFVVRASIRTEKMGLFIVDSRIGRNPFVVRASIRTILNGEIFEWSEKDVAIPS